MIASNCLEDSMEPSKQMYNNFNENRSYSIDKKVALLVSDVKYYFRRIVRILRRKIGIKDRYTVSRYGYKYASLDDTQNKIVELIESGKPMMVGRMGGMELNACIDSIKVEMGLKKECSKKHSRRVQFNAGFFPASKENLIKFSHIMQDSLNDIDILGSVITNNEEFFVKHYLPKTAVITDIGNLEPYYSYNPWTRVLKGKKVLVIYPFADSILKQYENKRSILFDNPDVLPDFSLKVMKSVQSIAGTKTDFNDWFEALDYMFNEAMKFDFDIAIIGCGAYGFPLSSMIKRAGRQAIHLGGATQILFGVWGERWEHIDSVRKLKKESWVRPSKAETPDNAKKVENACYW